MVVVNIKGKSVRLQHILHTFGAKVGSVDMAETAVMAEK
jgi:hypothetical protein